MHPIADCAATLGSRFNLIFDPHDDCLFHNAYGHFRERPLHLTAGVRLKSGEVLRLPFGGEGDVFPFVEQHSTLTSVTYRGLHPEHWVDFRLTVRAPFYPQDVKLSTAPVYYVDLSVRRLKKWRWTSPGDASAVGEIVFALAPGGCAQSVVGSGTGLSARTAVTGGKTGIDGVEAAGMTFRATEDGFAYEFESHPDVKWFDPENPDLQGLDKTVRVPSRLQALTGDVNGEAGFSLPFEVDSEEPVTMRLLWSGWTDEAVLEVNDELTPFKYHQFFKNSEDRMLAWASQRRESIEERCSFLDGLFETWSLGQATTDLSALALHSFLANTWWTRRKGDADWFSVWEGSCYFHSTIDVEYNDSLLYFAFWPELLDMLLDEWPAFEVDAAKEFGAAMKGTSYLCHDMGASHLAGVQYYPHHMEVEENANYLLLLAARTFTGGETERASEHLALCRRLARFIVQADTTGSGFPDVGTANTIDDASPAVQFGKEQVYLGVKAQAALWALAEVEKLVADEADSQAERWRAFASKGIKTLNEKGWLGDHFAVSLTRETDGLVDPWTGEALPAGELQGWDDYSIYTANGLLYLLASGMKLPRWNLKRFAIDVEAADRATRTPYGGTHTAGGDDSVWISQNLWRDYVAAYLGVDMLNNVEAYWNWQVTSGHNRESALYYDTNLTNNLNFYPRGATVFGAAAGAAGLRLNRAAGELALAPVRATLRVPLLPLADWDNMRVPLFIVQNREGVPVAQITERDLLDGLAVHAENVEMEAV